jgi:hypothetical protein
MTPNQKAKDIFNKYQNHFYIQITDSAAKEYSLIAVDEIINNVLIGINLAETWGDYWNKVKKEIEIL